MVNYFAFFGLPVSPLLDEAALRAQFLENSRRFHPDFYTLAGEDKQAEALEQSTLNNQAYRALLDPDLRLRHLLELHEALPEEGQNQLPQDFLMEVMELNESLMELEFDDAPGIRAQVAEQIAALETALQTEIEPLLKHYDDQSVSPETLVFLKNFYLKRRYLLRIKENSAKFAPH